MVLPGTFKNRTGKIRERGFESCSCPFPFWPSSLFFWTPNVLNPKQTYDSRILVATRNSFIQFFGKEIEKRGSGERGTEVTTEGSLNGIVRMERVTGPRRQVKLEKGMEKKCPPLLLFFRSYPTHSILPPSFYLCHTLWNFYLFISACRSVTEVELCSFSPLPPSHCSILIKTQWWIWWFSCPMRVVSLSREIEMKCCRLLLLGM